MSGRRATLSPAGYRRAGNLGADGLVVHAVGQAGEEHGTYDFHGCPGPEALKRDLVAAFAGCAAANGRWGSAKTCDNYAKYLRHFLRFAAACSPPVTAVGRISSAVWNRWTLPDPRRRQLRVVLLEMASLPADTRAAMQARRRAIRTGQVRSYTLEEFKAIRGAAGKTVRSAELRIDEGAVLLQRWRAGQTQPGSVDAQWGWLLEHISRTGELPHSTVSTDGTRYLSRSVRRLLGAGGGPAALARLYPTYAEMGAAVVLLVCHEAWNLSVVETMRVPEQWPNADSGDAAPAIHRVDTDKPRRGPRRRHGSNNVVDVGEGSPGRAMAQVAAITAQARITLGNLGTPNTRLLWSRRAKALEGGSVFADGTTAENAIKAWSASAGLTGGDGPLRVGARRLRRTVQVLYGGPRNNTVRTHQDVYLLRDEQVREEAGQVVAAGLAEAVEHAAARVRMRMVADATGVTAAAVRQVAEQAGVAAGIAARVVAGRLDTAAAACIDFEHSPFTVAGPCTVSFLLCFACPNAVATGRHLPRIVYLHKILETLRATLDASTWAADWAGHHARVADLVHTHTTDAERARLLVVLTDRDREPIDRMLERRLDP
ncbi:hypothetical protein AB0H83_23600 [Dactylosporangium sp. NPDC050688]|uniref:hypothetical protein n=1 Tax=Dactylosporangium sp. NPDC050688 TaxID=3157217 RepID=UPI0033D0D4EA